LCVYGSCDWGRWDEAPNTVTLSDVVLRDPGRFLASWWANIRGFFGTGGEDTSEFGRAIQLRLLGFPANWLALGGLLAWSVAIFHRRTTTQPQNLVEQGSEGVSLAHPLTRSPAQLFTMLLIWIGLYVLAICVGIALPRFFLPLAPIYALAAAWTITRLEPRTENREPADQRPTTNDQRRHASRIMHHASRNVQLIAAMLLLICLWGGFATGTGYVLRNQPAGEAAAVQLVLTTLQPGERVVVRAPPRVAIDTASAIAHLVVPEHGQYLLTSTGSPPSAGTIVGTAGQYTLYRITP
jgi:hypothetical protein